MTYNSSSQLLAPIVKISKKGFLKKIHLLDEKKIQPQTEINNYIYSENKPSLRIIIFNKKHLPQLLALPEFNNMYNFPLPVKQHFFSYYIL